MLRTPLIRYYQFLEHCKQAGFLDAVKLTFYKCEKVCPVEKDLSGLKEPAHNLKEMDCEIIELDEHDFSSLPYKYCQRSRHERARSYFKQGFKTLVLVKGQEVIGDIWYVSRSNSRMACIHPRVKWFGIQLADDDVYLFDMYMTPDERGGSLTTTFMVSALKHLREKGFTKAYGDYVVTNIPALWIHRMLGYKERSYFIVKRYFIFESAGPCHEAGRVDTLATKP